ncbi:MAG: HAD-IC family P-type ATPase [Albidovulum sp.]|uniref:cation-translocating P-type ATPase n=1 Tax=Albidovulum sp. TaxID=1872424 RepID=UPI003CA3E6B0
MNAGIKPVSAAGLSAIEVVDRQQRFGPNEIKVEAGASRYAVLMRQFTSPLVLMLVAAAGLAAWIGDIIDTVAILLVVLLNGILGFVQEWRAETAIFALRRMLSPVARVRRDGMEQIVPARDLVPGDAVLLEAGDRVPADIRLVYAMALRVDESVLTGESAPLDKSLAEGENRLLMGTSVAAGRAEGVITVTGAETEFGKIAGLTATAGGKITNLQRHLGVLARQMGIAALFLSALVAGLGIFVGRPVIEMVMTGLSLAVAIVPEGLPAVVTVTLALGASAMVRQKALVRRLQAVETLGAASVICTDKTGTLTENKMTATVVRTPDRRYTVTGTGYDPAGHVETEGQRIRAADDAALSALLNAAITCNNARLNRVGSGWEMIGEATEGALVTLAYKGWVPEPDRHRVVLELPFDSDRRRMSVILRDGSGHRLYAKGAPEAILSVSAMIRRGGHDQPMGSEDKAALHDLYEQMAAEGLRVIALATRDLADIPDTPEENLVFLGFVGMIDPPRPEVKAAIAGARAAGIRVIMITGDAPQTAAAIARDLGLAPELVLTGDAVAAMTDDDLAAALEREVLFARTAPGQKLRIVERLQAGGKVVAMTGDGVNDAPALKRADIGVAMGQRGTDVAKDAADLVLLDDNFATIVGAIREGRRQFDNVRKFVRYLLSSNAGEVIAILANILIGGPLVFLATQILWMNLVTDGITAVALGVEKSEAAQMRRPPRRRDEPIVGKAGLLTILAFGLYTGGASLWVFQHFMHQGVDIARTAAFTAMVVFEKTSVFAFRSLRSPCFRIGWFSNPALILAFLAMLGLQVLAVYWPPLQALLHTTPLGWDHWALIALIAAPILLGPELIKVLLPEGPAQPLEENHARP